MKDDGKSLTGSQSSASDGRKRIGYLDALRVLAIVLVIGNHTAGTWLLGLKGFTPNWWFGVAFFFVCKTAVPLFVMISGALLLRKEEGFRKAWRRIGRIFPALVAVSAIYYLSFYRDWSLPVFLDKLWHNGFSVVFWYLYMYLGLLIMLPLLQILCARLDANAYRYMLAVSFGFVCLVPVVNAFVPRAMPTPYFQMPLFTGYLGLFFCGRYLSGYFAPTRKTVACALPCFAVLLVFLCRATRYFRLLKNGSNYLVMDNCTLTPIVLMAGCIFVLFRHFAEKKERDGESLWDKAVQAIAPCTFGMYLTHIFYVRFLRPWFQKLCLTAPDIPSLLLFELAVFALSFCTTWLLRRIPVLKRII